MDYTKIYNSLISKRKTERYVGYTEKHHIIPACLGGSNSSDNIVSLSAREHYICHLLLTKMYNNRGLITAAYLMGSQSSSTSRNYSNLREKFALIQKEHQTGSNNSQFGTKWIYSKELEVSRKIKITEEVPEGFVLGRIINFNKKHIPSARELKKSKNKVMYSELYTIYAEVGWVKFVDLTKYDKSKANFVQMCKKYVDDFVPQNGKQRGSHV